MSFEELRSVVEVPEAGDAPLIMAGPCSAETEEQTLATARQLAAGGLKSFQGRDMEATNKSQVVLKE